jgi:hypothetical protein
MLAAPATTMRSLPILLAVALPLAAQRTFVVDAANGAGTHFTDLPPALAQAQHRDVFLVRAGAYSPASTDKGVSLLGTAGVRIDGGSGTVSPLVVTNLPAGETFAVCQVELRALTATGLQALDCSGRLHLEGLLAGSLFPAPSLVLTRCREVTVAGSQLTGVVRATESVVVVTRSTLTGQQGIGGGVFSTPGLALLDATALVTDCTLRGGDGFFGGGSGVAPAAAVSATGSQLALAATAPGHTALIGGICSGGFCSPILGAPACALIDSAARYAPSVAFTTQYNNPPFALFGSSQATPTPLPALVAQGAQLGGMLSATLASAPGDPFLLAVAVPGDPLFHPAGTLFVDFGAWAVLVQTVQGAIGRTTVSVAVPNEAALRGEAFVVQAASISVANQTLFFTHPDIVILH